MAADDLGDLTISVGGDISPLEDALGQIPAAVNAAAQAFEGFTAASAPLDTVQAAATGAAESIGALGAAASVTSAPLQDIYADFLALQQALADAQANFQLTTQAFHDNAAGAGQVETAANELKSAFEALNGTENDSRTTAEGVAREYANLQGALSEAQSNLQTVTTAYQNNQAGAGQVEAATQAVAKAYADLNGAVQQAIPPLEQIKTDFDSLQSALTQAQQNLRDVTAAYQQNQAGLGQVEQAAKELRTAYQDLNGTFEKTKESTDGLVASLAGLYILKQIADSLVSFAENALQAAGEIQRLTLSLELLTGSAKDTQVVLQGIESIALSQGLKFENLDAAAQKMIAFGVSAQQVPGLLQAAADAAAATGNSFDTVANALARVFETGQISARQLVALGVNIQDLAKEAGLSIQQMTAALKKGVLDGQTAVDLLQATVHDKFSGAAKTAAEAVTAQFQILENQITVTLRNIGTALAPFAQNLINTAESILPAVNGLVSAFQSLDPETRAIIVTLGELVIAIPAVAAAIQLATIAFSALEIATGPVGIALLAIGAAIAYINFKDATTEAGSFVSVLKENLPYIVGQFSPYFEGAVKAVSNSMQELIDKTGVAGDAAKAASIGWAAWNIAINAAGISAQSAITGIQALGDTAQHQADNLYAASVKTLSVVDSLNRAMNDSVKQQLQAMLQAQIAADIATAAANQAAKAANTWNTSWDKSAEKAIQDFIDLQDATGDTSGALGKLNSAILSGEVNIDRMSDASKKLFVDLKNMQSLATDDKAAAAQTAAVDKLQDEVTKLSDTAGLELAKIPTDFASAMQAVSNGQSFNGLDNQITAQIAKIRQYISTIDTANLTEAQALVAQDAINVGQKTIAGLQAAKEKIDSITGSLKTLGADSSMNKLAAQIQGFDTVADKGELTANQLQTGLGRIASSLLTGVVPAMQHGEAASDELLGALVNLNNRVPGLGTTLATAAKQGGDAFAAALAKMSDESIKTELSVDAAFAAIGQKSIPQAAASMDRAGALIVAQFKDINGSVQEGTPEWNQYAAAIVTWSATAIPKMQATGEAVKQDVVDRIALIAPALAAAAASGNWERFKQAAADFAQQWKDGIGGADEAFQTFGLHSVASLDSILAHQQREFAALVAMNAPLADQLAAAQQILATRMKTVAATEDAASAELSLAVASTKVSLGIYAVHQQTNGLADAWKGLATGIATAWTNMEDGLAKAIVAGKGFGDVFKKLFSDIELQIVEVAVKYLLGQLVSALLTSIGFSGTLTGALGLVGGAASTSGTLVSASAAAAAASQAAYAGTTVASSATSSTAVVAATGTIVSSFGLIAVAATAVGSIVGAIAGIIGDIQQSHANKLLGEIEITTRKMEAELGGNGGESVFGYTKLGAQTLQTIMAMLWTPIIALLNDISGNLDSINSTLKNGLTVNTGTGTGSGTPTPIVTDPYGTGGSVPTTFNQGLALPVSQLLAQIQAEIDAQNKVIQTDQDNLTAITNLYNQGKATSDQVNNAQGILKDAQTQLKSLQDQLVSANQNYITAVTGAANATNNASSATDSYSSSVDNATQSTADLAATMADAAAQAKAAALAATVTWAEQIIPLLKDGATISYDTIQNLSKISPELALAAGKGTEAFEQALLNIVDTQFSTTIANASTGLSKASNTISSSSTMLMTSASNLQSSTTAFQSIPYQWGQAAGSLQAAAGAMAAAANLIVPAVKAVVPGLGAGFDAAGIVITPVGQYHGSVGSSVPPGGVGGTTITVPITVQGNVVGQNGMSQLADTVGDSIITKMRRNVSLIKS